jgi:hypothetical protein
MADSRLSDVLRNVSMNRAGVSAVAAFLGQFGARGAVALARSYLGPDAPAPGREAVGVPAGEPTGEVAREPAAGVAGGSAPGTEVPPRRTSRARLSKDETAILALALSKLIYELGELALKNPTLDPAGEQPVFKLDGQGRAPALSVTHVLAAARLLQARAEERKRAAEAAQTTTPPGTPRARLQAARTERYAAVPRYAYNARPVSYRSSR